ncbi:MAG: hypothetical protein HC933_16065 [Pleurocapsa sp. SU_196_0]|nr:hypothetical protein [Pleurocapsa sp. SU_196_0]
MMPDLTLCVGSCCPLERRTECYRFRAVSSEAQQSWNDYSTGPTVEWTPCQSETFVQFEPFQGRRVLPEFEAEARRNEWMARYVS